MKTITVGLGARSYPIHVGEELLGQRELLAPHLGGGRVLVVTDETVAPLYLEAAMAGLDGTAERLVLPDGERFKTLETFARIIDALADAGCGRDAVAIALGGGVIGDLVGFAAACYQRGIAWIQIPTTLLAQVDAAVGGKTAVNHAAGKNLIGAFHQPRCVLADCGTLVTLDERQYRAGLAEVIKYGLIADPEFFAWLEGALERLLARESQTITSAVAHCCRAKAAIVEADEREESGRRAVLNLGHTFGHAIERALGYGSWLHGEAVAAGMALAADMSRRLGLLQSADVERIEALLARAGLPRRPPAIEAEDLLESMQFDKKARGGRVHLVLLEAIGRTRVTADYPQAELVATLKAACG